MGAGDSSTARPRRNRRSALRGVQPPSFNRTTCGWRMPAFGRLEESAPAPAGRALLGEGANALAEVLGPEARPSQLDELLLPAGRQRAPGGQQLADDALVAAQRQGRVGGDLARQLEPRRLELV